MLDESLLDDAEALTRADTRGLLLGTAEAGARVRNAMRESAEAGVADLRPDGRPRALIVAGPGAVAHGAADLLRALTGGSCPVTALEPTGSRPEPSALEWVLPGWVGPYDLLLVATGYGREPGLSALVDQAYHRGCSVVAVSPRSSQLAEMAGSRGLAIPYISLPEGTADGGGLWPMLIPMVAVADRLGVLSAPPAVLQRTADRLDTVAERCGPVVATYSNPAKTLATEFSESLPLLWSEGPAACAAARHLAARLAAVAGRPALAAELPEALVAHTGLLSATFAAGADPDDFFRDRVEEPMAMRARVLLLREEVARGGSALPAARELALSHGAPLSELAAADGGTLEAAAELIATADFTAVYLTLAAGRG